MQTKQRTIKQKITLTGKGLQTGKISQMTLLPAGENYGISFIRKDVALCREMRLKDGFFPQGARRRTEIDLSGVKLQTVEHFMSALWALGIDNLKVEVFGEELPAMDGSALGFLESIKRAGNIEQESPRRYIRVEEPIQVSDNDRKITVMPSEKFSVSYLIDYPLSCIKKETFRIDLDEASFESQIAPARTFCMKKEALFLFISGLGRGATFENTLVLGKSGPVKTALRFHNEPVRHKVLDLVGDLYTLGIPIIGEFICERSGHALNARVLKEIYSKYVQK